MPHSRRGYVHDLHSTAFIRPASHSNLCLFHLICKQYRGLVPSRCCINYSYTSQESIDGVGVSLSLSLFGFIMSGSDLSVAPRCIISSEALLDGHVLYAFDTTISSISGSNPFPSFYLEIQSLAYPVLSLWFSIYFSCRLEATSTSKRRRELDLGSSDPYAGVSQEPGLGIPSRVWLTCPFPDVYNFQCCHPGYTSVFVIV